MSSSLVKLQFTLLAAALAAAYPFQATAAGAAGVAQFTAGDVNVRSNDGKTNPLAKGNDIESGQSIVTGATGRAQVKFSDGGLISLQPNTEFKIANYSDNAANPKDERFLVDLLRGSMRAITGLIGKRNRENYKVTTTTATIGIRGSGFNVGYNPDGSLGVTTELDAIEVCNAGGCVGLTAGESVRVVNNQEAPVRTNVRASVPTPGPEQDPVVVGNQTTSDGKAAIVPVAVKQVFTDLAVGIVFNDVSTSNVSVESYVPDPSLAVITSLVNGKLTDFSQLDGSYRIDFKDTGATAIGGKLGATTDADFVGWGSWVSGQRVDSGGSNASLEAIHYVLGRPTPTAQMPSNGFQGTYQLAGGTAFSNMLGMGELTSGSLIANFGAYGYGSFNLNTRFAGNDYAVNGSLNINNSKITGTSGTNVTGFFTGSNASRAALVYTLPTNSAAGQISGAAAFQQNNLVYVGNGS